MQLSQYSSEEGYESLMNSLKQASFHLSVCRYAEKHRSDSKHVHTQPLSELKSFQLKN